MKKIMILSAMLCMFNMQAQEQEKATSLYVTATAGLSLREYSNLNSEKLAIMPYGAKIEVVLLEENTTMNVKGVKGGMHQMSYNNKVGFAFSGYLSKLFPPESGSSAEAYLRDLSYSHPEASFQKCASGTASKPESTETILLPTDQWHEAFAIAKKLYSIPYSFAMPNPKGRELQTISIGSDEQDGIYSNEETINELQIKRSNDSFEEITWFYSDSDFGSFVKINQQNGLMKIEFFEALK